LHGLYAITLMPLLGLAKRMGQIGARGNSNFVGCCLVSPQQARY